jgi:hypothetical protein
VITDERDANLLQIVEALRLAGAFARGMNRRQQNRDQQSDNRDNDQHLDQCESAPHDNLLLAGRGAEICRPLSDIWRCRIVESMPSLPFRVVVRVA